MSLLGEDDKRLLLRHARQAIEEKVRYQRESPAECPPGPYAGAFVTLRKGSRLRGCIGYVEGTKSMIQTVRECAVAAAVRDPRFAPVAAEELSHLRLEISVLSPLVDASLEQIEIGKHGLQVSRGYQRGVLLPQVASEYRWDAKRFLEETCRKAGLPPDAWQRGARVQVFTAQVFSESDEPSDLSAPSVPRKVSVE